MATRRNEALGVKLKRILQERQISQAAFAQRTRIAPHQLSRLLSGERKFERKALEASARALQMSPEQLASGTKERALLEEAEARPRAAARRAAPARGEAKRARAPEVQMTRAEITSLQIANRELTQRVSELESQLSTCEKQCQMLRQRAERGAPGQARRGEHLAKHPTGRRRVFGAALFAGLLGLGLRAVRRAA